MMNKIDQLQHRLDKLERQNRALRTLLIALGGVVIAACTTLSADRPSVHDASISVRTQSLQIVDENNQVVAELGQAGLLIRDRQARVRVSLHHNDEETGLYLNDEAGDSRVGIAHFAHGGSGVALHGPAVRGAAVLYYKKNGSLSFYEPDGTLRQRIPE